MNLKEYVENLNKLLEERPEVGNLKVVYAKDDEGNAYYNVSCFPAIGYHNIDHEFYEEGDQMREWGVECPVNSVCIN